MSSLYEEGLRQQQQGQLEKASQLFRRAAGNAEVDKDVELQQQCLGQLVNIAIEQDNSRLAINALKKLLSLQRSLDDSKGQAATCLQIATLLFHRKDVPEATAWAYRGLNLAELGWSRQQMAEAQHLLGLLYIQGEFFEDAIQALRRAQDVWEELRDQNGYYDSTFHLGMALQYQQEPASAAKEFRQCLGMLRTDDLEVAADLHMRLCSVCFDGQWYAEGIVHALAALGRFRKLQSQEQYYALNFLMKLQKNMGKAAYEEELAKHLDAEGLRIFQKMFADYLQNDTTQPFSEAEPEDSEVEEESELELALSEQDFLRMEAQEKSRNYADVALSKESSTPPLATATVSTETFSENVFSFDEQPPETADLAPHEDRDMMDLLSDEVEGTESIDEPSLRSLDMPELTDSFERSEPLPFRDMKDKRVEIPSTSTILVGTAVSFVLTYIVLLLLSVIF